MEKFFIATRAFIVHDNKLLMIRECEGNPDGSQFGKWDFPGGRMDSGESVLECLHRETQEEAGIAIETTEPFHVCEWNVSVRGETWHIVAIYFLCKPLDLEIKLSEHHDEFMWMPLSDYKKHPLMEENYKAIEAYLKRKH